MVDVSLIYHSESALRLDQKEVHSLSELAGRSQASTFFYPRDLQRLRTCLHFPAIVTIINHWTVIYESANPLMTTYSWRDSNPHVSRTLRSKRSASRQFRHKSMCI